MCIRDRYRPVSITELIGTLEILEMVVKRAAELLYSDIPDGYGLSWIMVGCKNSYGKTSRIIVSSSVHTYLYRSYEILLGLIAEFDKLIAMQGRREDKTVSRIVRRFNKQGAYSKFDYMPRD
jgi:hypothetical protein